jgi:hypothetical protein
MIQWFRNYLSDIKTAWMLVQYKRRSSCESLLDRDHDIRSQRRAQLWQEQRINDSGLSDIHVPYRDLSAYMFQDQEDDGYEYSNGATGYQIKRKIDAIGKSIGMYVRWDLFYFGIKDKDERSYNSFIYLSTDGISKHDWSIEIIGVDIV